MGFFFKKNDKSSEEIPHGKVLAFLNQKGGVGKTTMAFNTAHALAEKGHRVLCLDMDPQANLTLLCGIDADEYDRPGIHQLLINSVKELAPLHQGALLHDCIVKGDKVDLLPAGQELSGFELTVAGISLPRQFILKRFIEKNNLLSLYDYIVIDGPPTLGLIVVNIMCAAHGLLVPFRPDEFSRKGLGHFYEVLENIEEMGLGPQGRPDVIAHIPNLVDLRRKQETDDLNKIQTELEEEFGAGVVTEPFINRAPLVRSQAERKSVFDFKSKEFHALQDQFNEIAGKITAWNQKELS